MDAETWTRRHGRGDMDAEISTRRHGRGDMDAETWTRRYGHGHGGTVARAWRHGHGHGGTGTDTEARTRSTDTDMETRSHGTGDMELKFWGTLKLHVKNQTGNGEWKPRRFSLICLPLLIVQTEFCRLSVC
jgi:hypothetical protein